MTPAPPSISAEIEPHPDWIARAEPLAEGHRGPEPALGDLFPGRSPDTLLTAPPGSTAGGRSQGADGGPRQPRPGLLSFRGALILFDDPPGALEALIDSALVTRWKTAADARFSARLLSRCDPDRLLIPGAGAIDRGRAPADGRARPVSPRPPARASAGRKPRGALTRA